MKKKILGWSLAFLMLFSNVAWAGENPDLLKTNKKYIGEKYRLATGAKAPKTKLDFQLLRPNMRVMESSPDGLWFVGGNDRDGYGRVLYISKDLGDSFEYVYAFKKPIEGVHISPKNTIFVSVSNDRWSKDAQCEIFRSLDGGKTFKKVLDLKSGAAINWNFASDKDGYVFISEYGYKELPNNARRIYRSKDNGESFQIVYSPKEKSMSHNHVIQIDQHNKNIIYQSIGDKYKEILVSRDRGSTWTRMVNDYNPTSMVQMGSYILMGLDNHPRSGVIKLNKASGQVSQVFSPKKPISGSIYDMLYVDNILYAGLLSYSQPSHTWPGTMYISKDWGANWENIMTWPKINSKSGIGFYNMFEKDGYGFINGMFPLYVDGQPGHYVGTMKFKLLKK